MLHVINGALLMNHFTKENLYYYYAPNETIKRINY